MGKGGSNIRVYFPHWRRPPIFICANASYMLRGTSLALKSNHRTSLGAPRLFERTRVSVCASERRPVSEDRDMVRGVNTSLAHNAFVCDNRGCRTMRYSGGRGRRTELEEDPALVPLFTHAPSLAHLSCRGSYRLVHRLSRDRQRPFKGRFDNGLFDPILCTN